MDSTQYETLIGTTAYKIVAALREFERFSPDVKNQVTNATMARVNKILNGEPITIEGPGLVCEVADPQADPA